MQGLGYHNSCLDTRLTRAAPLSIKNVDEGNNDRKTRLPYPGGGRKEKKVKKIENRANPTTPSPIEIWNGPALLHGHISTAASRFDFSLDKEHK